MNTAFVSLGVGLPGSGIPYGARVFSVLRKHQTVPEVYHFAFLPAKHEHSFAPSLQQHLAFQAAFCFCHFNGCVVTSHGGFNCISLLTNDVEHLFRCLPFI